MSDRIAVFNHGRIEQIAAPAAMYEHPATVFVAGFIGTSNLIERDGRRVSVRPEKIRMLEAGVAVDEGARSEDGVVSAVHYVGPMTRYLVDLDRGGTLHVLSQNLEETSSEVAAATGRRVRLQWHPAQESSINEQEGSET